MSALAAENQTEDVHKKTVEVYTVTRTHGKWNNNNLYVEKQAMRFI